jgi:hypothetical protein
MEKESTYRQIRIVLLVFIVVLFLSGLTAIPIDLELSFLLRIIPAHTLVGSWLSKVLVAYKEVNSAHPFLMYGYDWLAFAHFVLAILFIGPLRDPVRNIWVIEFGMIACVLVLPLAFIAGPFRGIPIGWQLIDCSFGIVGLIPLYICYRKVKKLEIETNYSH